jgi:large subunit ribosomal protein L35Ae
MEGKVDQFRRGRHVYKEKHFILDFGLTKKQEAEKLVGKEVEWLSSAGKSIKGKISSAHGNSGKVRAIFESGLPGQALTTRVIVK